MDKEELLKKWVKLKAKEDAAKLERRQIEKDIEGLFPTDKKSQTFHEPGFKIVVKKNTSIKFVPEWEQVREEIPAELRPEKISYTPDIAGMDYLKSEKPEIYRLCSDYIEEKPLKTGIKITREDKK